MSDRHQNALGLPNPGRTHARNCRTAFGMPGVAKPWTHLERARACPGVALGPRSENLTTPRTSLAP
eukprot:6267494-Lingulodinium_polyedra.AAC.1